MRDETVHIGLGVLTACLLATPAFGQDTPTVPNFEDDIKPIMTGWCLDCHRGSRAKNGFDVSSLAAMLDGGSSGPAIIPGDGGSSLLYQLVAHEREPVMPHEDDPLPPELVQAIRQWIDAGAPLNADSPTIEREGAETVVAAPVPAPAAGGAVMPGGLPTQPYWWSESGTAIKAIAASPAAPLIAVGAHGQVSLYDAETHELLGILDFPEGEIETLRFGRTGELLLAGGGKGASLGRAVAWSVGTGERVLEIGSEPDVVLATDITSDHGLVSLGGPDGIVRTFSTETRETVYEIDEHTDWVTALAFSPDDVLLATSDRLGAVFVWETHTGRLFHTIPPSRGRVTSLAWRADSMVLAVASEDASIRLFEMENGSQVRSWNAHGGVLSLTWRPDGLLASAGRDRHARVWAPDGTERLAIGPLDDLATAVAATSAGGRTVVGVFTGQVTIAGNDGAAAGRLAAYPSPAAHTASINASHELAQVRAEASARGSELAEAAAALATASDERTRLAAELTSAQNTSQQASASLGDARAAADRAESLAEPFRIGAAAREAALAAARAALDQATAESDRARADMLLAVESLTAAQSAAARAAGTPEGATANADVELKTKLLDGARAVAQLAAANAAEKQIAHDERAAAVQQWAEAAAPVLADANSANDALRSAQAAATAATAEAERAAAASAESDARAAAAQAAHDQAAASATEIQARLSEAEKHAAATADAWAALHARIVENGGRVPRETDTAASD